MLRTTIRLLQVALIGASWILLFIIVSIFTQFFLAPWDTAIIQPAIGTIERTLNDIFSVYGGHYVIGGAVTLLSAAVAIRTTRRGQWKIGRLMLSNVTLMTLILASSSVAARISYGLLFPIPPGTTEPIYRGYHLTLLPMLVTAALIGGWLRYQWHIAYDRRKQKSHEPAAARLSLENAADDHAVENFLHDTKTQSSQIRA